MLRLLTFFSTYRNTILFLFLEAVALYLIISYPGSQRRKVGDWLMERTISYYEKKHSITEYFSLQAANEELKAENVELRQKLKFAQDQIFGMASEAEKDSISNIVVDEMPLSKDYEYITAKVIKYSTSKLYNYLVINKGSNEGVQVDMGVVSPVGVAGRIIRVSPEYSLALSALNVDFKLILKAVNQEGKEEEFNIGFFEWRGESARYAHLTYIPETVKLDTGYQVITSGSSQIFPPDYLVGKISDLGEKKDGYY
ncbi:MAG: rod shape-determining protein MreC, partial [Bacteroidetes bacterium]|nr:rod shape-determining protein MreC [Bacteroidota bacterium]